MPILCLDIIRKRLYSFFVNTGVSWLPLFEITVNSGAFTASGFGDETYNGAWEDSGETVNSAPQYTNGSRWIQFDGIADWTASENQDGSQVGYHLISFSAPPLGEWQVTAGTPPGGTTS